MEIFIQYFNKVVNSFQVAQIIVIDINTNAKVEACIPPVNDLEISELITIQISKVFWIDKIPCYLNKIGMFGVSYSYNRMDFFN